MQKLNIDQDAIFRCSSVFKERVISVNLKKSCITNKRPGINQCCVYGAIRYISAGLVRGCWVSGLVRSDGHRDLQHARPAVDGPAHGHHVWVSVSGNSRKQRAVKEQERWEQGEMRWQKEQERAGIAFTACLARVLICDCEACACMGWDWWGCSSSSGMLPRPAASNLYSGHSESATIDYF